MASDCNYLNFILHQLSDLDAVSFRQMMGEYIVYYKGKVIGGIYDNRFMVKPVESVVKNIRGEMACPYYGAHEMFYITDINDAKILCDAVLLVYDGLYKNKKNA